MYKREGGSACKERFQGQVWESIQETECDMKNIPCRIGNIGHNW